MTLDFLKCEMTQGSVRISGWHSRLYTKNVKYKLQIALPGPDWDSSRHGHTLLAWPTMAAKMQKIS
jgi:hypothetical protein